MRKSTDDMLKELYSLDTHNTYEFTFYGGTQWSVRNKLTQEGLRTDGGFHAIKQWLANDMKAHSGESLR